MSNYQLKYQNWLVNYSDLKGIARTLFELSGKVKFANTMASSIIDLEKDYKLYESDFFSFFPDIQNFVREEIASNLI